MACTKPWTFSELEKTRFLPRILARTVAERDDFLQNVTGVLLFADISGFTALGEKLHQSSNTVRGSDVLAQTLNGYLHEILEEMLLFGGDILKFAGDAVLVLWRARPQELAQTLRLALQCSQEIQAKHGSYETDMGQKMQVKIGISAGRMTLVHFGGSGQRYFCIFGNILDEVREAEGLANPGDIVLSAPAWELCEQHLLTTQRLGSRRALKVVGIHRMTKSECQEISCKLITAPAIRTLEEEGGMEPAFFISAFEGKAGILEYIPKTVLVKLAERVPPDLYSELRPVTILFIHLQIAEDTMISRYHVILHKASMVMLEILSPFKGTINKISMFDKGCTFLCVFGLSGEKLRYESIHALESALKFQNVCSTMFNKTGMMSAAVSSGDVFCGVTGHPERHEYTVIGRKVNLAARMMMHYPGVVSCDEVTYNSSRLPDHYFKMLPSKEMKGVTNPGSIYQYMGITEQSMFGLGLFKKRSEYSLLLGREKEIAVFKSCLKKASEHLCQRHILAFEGSTGSGKSHLLTELAYLGQAAGHRVATVELLEVNLRKNYSSLRVMMARALGLLEDEAHGARQDKLKACLQGTVEESSYCLLNDFFLVEFPISNKARQMPRTSREKELHSVLAIVLQKALGEFGIFFIDNAHFIDPASWTIVSIVLQKVSTFIVMSLAPGYTRTEAIRKDAAAADTKSQITTYLHLDKVKPSAVVQKACQILHVDSISRDLARFLIQICSGNLYYCKELLCYLMHENKLWISPQGWAEKEEDKWESLVASAVSTSALAATSSFSTGTGGRVCMFKLHVNLEDSVLPISLKEIGLAQLDQRRPMEQLILRFAAVIGPVFTTQLLYHILSAGIRKEMSSILDRLTSDHILMWLESREAPYDGQDATRRPADFLQAKCGMNGSPCSTSKERSGALAFCVPVLWEAAYSLWPKTQRLALQRKCAAFLERHAHRCKSCGQGDFVAFHHFAVSNSQDGESCQDLDDQDDSCSWAALVVAGEWMKRDRTRAMKDATGVLPQQQAFMEEVSGVARKLLPKSEEITEHSSTCKCEAIVESVLVPLAHHYLVIGNAAKAFYYLLECVAAYLAVSNNYMAVMKLNEAEVLRNSLNRKKEVIARFEEATFFSLKGEVCCRMGHRKLAKEMIRKGLSLLGSRFPSSFIGTLVMWQVMELHRFSTARRASSLPQEARKKKLAWHLRQSSCFSLLDHIFSQEGTSRGRRLSQLAARMKASKDRAAECYQ